MLDQALKQLPEVITQKIFDYENEFDYSFREARDIVDHIRFVPSKNFINSELTPVYRTDKIVFCEDDDSVCAKLARFWSNDEHPAEIIIKLIDKFLQCAPTNNIGSESVIVHITDIDDRQRLRQLYLRISISGEKSLFDIVAGKIPKRLFLKCGDMSQRRYSGLSLIFRGAVFVNMDFTGTIFNSVWLNYASFINCDLTNVSFYDCNLEHTDFSGSKLKRTVFENIRDLSRAVFNNVIFDHARFTQDRNRSGYYCCHKVDSTDELFLAKLRSCCSRTSIEGTFYLDKTSFQYTSASISPQTENLMSPPAEPLTAYQQGISNCTVM